MKARRMEAPRLGLSWRLLLLAVGALGLAWAGCHKGQPVLEIDLGDCAPSSLAATIEVTLKASDGRQATQSYEAKAGSARGTLVAVLPAGFSDDKLDVSVTIKDGAGQTLAQGTKAVAVAAGTLVDLTLCVGAPDGGPDLAGDAGRDALDGAGDGPVDADGADRPDLAGDVPRDRGDGGGLDGGGPDGGGPDNGRPDSGGPDAGDLGADVPRVPTIVGAACNPASTGSGFCGNDPGAQCMPAGPVSGAASETGVCSRSCMSDADCGLNGVCVQFQQGPQCVRDCTPGDPNACPPQSEAPLPPSSCQPQFRFCLPACTRNADCCAAGTSCADYCNTTYRQCLAVGDPAVAIGSVCQANESCTPNGFCLMQGVFGDPTQFNGGYCTVVGCDLGGEFSCPGGSLCISADLSGGAEAPFACYVSCGQTPCRPGTSCRAMTGRTPMGQPISTAVCQ